MMLFMNYEDLWILNEMINNELNIHFKKQK